MQCSDKALRIAATRRTKACGIATPNRLRPRPSDCRIFVVSHIFSETRSMRMRPVLILAFLGACTGQIASVSTGKARFAEYPDALFAALKTACDGPAQSFARPEPDLVECREYLPPGPTAAIILKYDGTIRDLPQLVIRFRARADDSGYLVENEVFLNVPQKSGAPLHVRQDDARVGRTLNALYRHSGGVPE